MTQIGFPLERAHEALDQFLADQTGRWFSDKDDKTLGHIITAEEYDELRNAYHHWREAQEVDEGARDLPDGYVPWRYSPLATLERLLPTEPLEKTLAWSMFRKEHGELDEDERHRVMGAAIACLLQVRLDPDGQGAVPVLSVGHNPDEPGVGLRWRIAFVTEVHGLYVRVTSNGFFGDEWGIVTGSGYRVAHGWYSRDDAARCAEALGRVLPNTDWMRLTPEAFTPEAVKAIKGTIQRYHYAGLYEDAPEPEPVPDATPEAATEDHKNGEVVR